VFSSIHLYSLTGLLDDTSVLLVQNFNILNILCSNSGKVCYRLDYMRCVQKVSGLTTVHEVDKAYRILTLIVFNIVPSTATHFTQRFCHCWKHFANSSFRMSNSVFVEFRLMSSVASNRCPFRTFLSLGNRKKSHSARSGEYGGCCN